MARKEDDTTHSNTNRVDDTEVEVTGVNSVVVLDTVLVLQSVIATKVLRHWRKPLTTSSNAFMMIPYSS